ncbi:hypothetical protein DVH24_002371 [Malus domestica]|uniref:EF-hand domain-containing protein n=2 Tax=Malus domestica TaxID=3750 RepID=A0A498ICI4_MALDO|nr:hypothetical protein DVH24_002371 [Malus domestica]
MPLFIVIRRKETCSPSDTKSIRKDILNPKGFLIYLYLNFTQSQYASPLLPSSWFPHHTILLDTKTPPPQSPPSSSLSLSLPLPLPSGGAHQVRMDPDELRRVFQMFDRNGDGRITKHELNDSLENLGIFIADKELFNMIKKIDVNGDGCVDIDEFGELYQSIMDERDEEEDMKEAFNVFDQNGDGFITVDELRSVLSSLGLKQGRTIEECKRMIMKVDMDGDGRVNYKEFKQMLKGGGFSALS